MVKQLFYFLLDIVKHSFYYVSVLSDKKGNIQHERQKEVFKKRKEQNKKARKRIQRTNHHHINKFYRNRARNENH